MGAGNQRADKRLQNLLWLHIPDVIILVKCMSLTVCCVCRPKYIQYKEYTYKAIAHGLLAARFYCERYKIIL